MSDSAVIESLERSLGVDRPDTAVRLDFARASDIRESNSRESGALFRRESVIGELPLPPVDAARNSHAFDMPLPSLVDKTQSLPSLSAKPRDEDADITAELMATLAIESLSPRAPALASPRSVSTTTIIMPPTTPPPRPNGLPLVSPRDSVRSSASASGLDGPILARARAECQQLDCYAPSASRNDANAVLSGRKVGAFVLRPSSQSNCVALSHVQVDGNVGHAVIKLRLAIDATIEYQLEDEAKLYPTIMALLGDHNQLDFVQAREAVAEIKRRPPTTS
jgi:hypothetical protein